MGAKESIGCCEGCDVVVLGGCDGEEEEEEGVDFLPVSESQIDMLVCVKKRTRRDSQSNHKGMVACMMITQLRRC